MRTNRVFNGLRLIETSTQSLLHPKGGGGGGNSQKIWVGVLPENLGGDVRPASLTLFVTKLSVIDPYPIYDLNVTSKSYFRSALSLNP